jgi:phage gp29-like protein
MDMVQDAVAVIPDDASFEFVKGDVKGSSDVFEGLVTFCNSEVSKAIIGQTLTTEAGDKGARSLGEVHIDVRADIIAEDRRRVERALNQLIEWIVGINFGIVDDLPKFTMYEEEDVDKTLAERDKLLADTGQVKFSQEYIERAYGFEKGDVTVVDDTPEPEMDPNKPDGKPAGGTAGANTGAGDDDGGEGFAEKVGSGFKDQDAIDTLIDSLSDEDLRAQTAFMEPVFALAEKSKTFKEFKDGLIDIFPGVRPVEVENALRNFIFAAETFGNLTGEDL